MRTRYDEEQLEEQHEINVTPFIDIMLVLLIIFMATASVSTTRVDVDLPTLSGQAAPPPTQTVLVTIKGDETVEIDGQAVADPLFAERLVQAFPDKETRIYLGADKQISYARLMDVMSLLRAAGYLKVALVALHQADAS